MSLQKDEGDRQFVDLEVVELSSAFSRNRNTQAEIDIHKKLLAGNYSLHLTMQQKIK